MKDSIRSLSVVVFLLGLAAPVAAAPIVVTAADSYRVVFALPELDTAFTDRKVLLADRRDGKPIIPSEGPLRMVVPGEKRFAR